MITNHLGCMRVLGSVQLLDLSLGVLFFSIESRVISGYTLIFSLSWFGVELISMDRIIKNLGEIHYPLNKNHFDSNSRGERVG